MQLLKLTNNDKLLEIFELEFFTQKLERHKGLSNFFNLLNY